MASGPTVDYPEVKKYSCIFGHTPSNTLLLLCYNVNHKFQFINLNQGRIMNLEFDSIEEAEGWLKTVTISFQIDFLKNI